MMPSASAAAKEDGDDDDEKLDEVGNSPSLSNGSMPSLLISEGVVSPVCEEDMIMNDKKTENSGLDSEQQLDNSQTAAGMGIPSMNSSSDWEIEGKGTFDDSFPPTSRATKQTATWPRSSSQLTFQNENINDDGSIGNDTTASLRSSQKTCTTPPAISYIPTKSGTPLSYYNRSGVDNKSWLDPFPTPDVSLHSRQSWTPDNTSSSNHRGRIIGANIRRSNCTKNNYASGQANEEWHDMIKGLPKLPCIEDMENDKNAREKKLTINNLINKSCPASLETMDDNMLQSFRQVSSETSLLPIKKRNSFPNSLLKRPSMGQFWTALRAGPDGNGIDIENDKQSGDWDESMPRRDSNGSIYRQNSNQYELVDRDRKKNIIESRQSAPLDTTVIRFHEWEGIKRRNVSNQSTKLQFKRPKSLDIVGINAVANAATLTNVTGADLAKEVILLRERGSITPGRFRSFLASPTVSRVRTSAQQRVITPVRTVLVKQKNSATTLVRNTRQKLAERKERRRLRRLARLREPVPSWWIVIPADHPYKVAWDVLTMLWSLLGAYRTHIRIRDRVFDQSPLIMLTEIWFTLDIMLNFVTEHKTRNGEVIKDGKTIWARYLTTWFLIDVLSLIPWERIYVRPIVEKIKRRNFFQKTFFRSRAVVRVSRVLRGRHIKLFGRVSRQTGTPLRRMVTLIIQYLPKYLVFLRNMKAAMMVRSLRLVHWWHNIYKKIWVKAKSGIYFRRKSKIRDTGNSVEESEESHGDDESDSDQDDESEIGHDGIGENMFHIDEHVPAVGIPRRYSAPSTPVQRRRCYSSF